MPSWKIHKKWCKALKVKEEICEKINRIIDDPSSHDIVDRVLKWGWARDAFESGILSTPFCIVKGDEYEKVTSKLAEITNKFGEEGIKATFSHIALDRIAELIELGYSKEEIRERLIENGLIEYIPDYDEVFRDVSREVKPSEQKIKRRKEFEELARSGRYGVFYVDGKILLGPAGLNYIKSRIRKGEEVYVKWGTNVERARRGRIRRFISNEEELWELIREIKDQCNE